MRENKYQAQLVKKIESILTGSVVVVTDGNYIQGFPDILVLFNNRWGALECKKSGNETKQPNQEYYIDMLNDMSYASFIFPENEEAVLNELQQALGN